MIVIDHEMKVSPEYYNDVESGLKPFEVRIDDREPRYVAGDVLRLREWNGEYTGRECIKRATYVLRDAQFCKDGYCIIGIAPYAAEATSIERLHALIEADREGRCEILPCAIGKDVYALVEICSNGYPDPAFETHISVKRFAFEDRKRFGKTVFLTRAEAEAALKESSHERD